MATELPISLDIRGVGITRMLVVDDEVLDPRKSQEVYNHSPDGFNWGYGGSGPAQSALAILMHVMKTDEAIKYYQIFKNMVISQLTEPNFHIKVNIQLFVENTNNGFITTFDDIVKRMSVNIEQLKVTVKKSEQ